MTVYAANSNGDWWEVAEDTDIFLINTEDEAIESAMRDDEIEVGDDKFERFIQLNGKGVLETLKKALVEDTAELNEYQEQEEEEDYGDAMTSMKRTEFEGRTDVLAWVISLLEGN